MSLYPVRLDQQDIERFYEGFSNATLRPLDHDVIVAPEFHSHVVGYVCVGERRFADGAAGGRHGKGGTIRVHDYQLQLVLHNDRDNRTDVRIGFFNDIPFPSVELFSSCPNAIRSCEDCSAPTSSASSARAIPQNFLGVRKLLGYQVDGHDILVPGLGAAPVREVAVQTFPISIDSDAAFLRSPRMRRSVSARSSWRRDLGDPDKVVLGVDRLDYTKGIRHRLKPGGSCSTTGPIDPHEDRHDPGRDPVAGTRGGQPPAAGRG